MKQKLLISLLCSISLFTFAVEPYDSVQVLSYFEHGWFNQSNANYLAKFIETLKPKVIIEVGTWLGKSAMFMADKLEKGSQLYAVDTFKGSPEHVNNILLTDLYRQFLSNVIHRKLTDKIIPVKLTSLEAAKTLEIKAQLIYLDAAHDYDNVYADIIAWYPHLDVGGIICGDDYNWDDEQVSKAVHKAAAELNQTVQTDGDRFWFFPPKK